jgi:hypothetical protein
VILAIERDTRGPDYTLGILHVEGKKLHTIEPPWVPSPTGGRAGAPFISCVPAGLYKIEPYKRPCGERAWILSSPELGVYQLPFEVPREQRGRARSLVTIRAANYAYDAVDAIGVGTARVKTNVGWKLERSLDALNILRTVVNGTLDLTLRIEDAS